MPHFRYAAQNEQGERLKGTIDAADITAAETALQDLKLTPSQLDEVQPEVPEEKPIPKLPEEIETFSIHQNAQQSQTPAVDWQSEQEVTYEVQPDKVYYPITDTLRLYAGWQLAIYVLVYALSYYQLRRSLAFDIPYVNGILYSPLVLTFTFASFLFLLLTSVHKSVGNGKLVGLLLSMLGITAFILYRSNV